MGIVAELPPRAEMNEWTIMPDKPVPANPTPRSLVPLSLRRWVPRAETLVLVLALLWTLAAKGYIVLEQMGDEPLVPFLEAVLPDAIFFTAVAMIFLVMGLIERRRFVPRLTLLLATLVLGWSVLNASWLITTSVQLQPGVLGVLLASSSDMGPMVATYLGNNLLYAIPLIATVLAAGLWFIWRLVSPVPLTLSRGQLVNRLVLAGIVLIAAAGAQQVSHRRGITAYSGQVLSKCRSARLPPRRRPGSACGSVTCRRRAARRHAISIPTA